MNELNNNYRRARKFTHNIMSSCLQVSPSFHWRGESRSLFIVLNSHRQGNSGKINDDNKFYKLIIVFMFISMIMLMSIQTVYAHHVLGRPSYSLSADSNTPPSMQVETQIGEYYVTYMAFPAFPKPNEQGRVNLYASRIDNGATYHGEVTFKVRDDSWFSNKEEIIGTQKIDDGVYRQGFIFKETGNYVIVAEFESGGEPYVIDFPLRIGEPLPFGPIGIAVLIIVIVLFGVNITQRKRMQRLKASQHHQDNRESIDNE